MSWQQVDFQVQLSLYEQQKAQRREQKARDVRDAKEALLEFEVLLSEIQALIRG